MQFTLVGTTNGKILEFYLKETAILYQQIYGGYIIQHEPQVEKLTFGKLEAINSETKSGTTL